MADRKVTEAATSPELVLARILVEAGATPAQAARGAVVLAAGGTVAEALAAMEIAPSETFPPESLICRVYGGGGNRTRVTCPTENPLSSENALASGDDKPRPPLVTPRSGA